MRNNLVKKSLTIEPKPMPDVLSDPMYYVEMLTALGNGWHELVNYGSCKLYGRKRGFWMEIAVFHYGYYDCCRAWKEAVELPEKIDAIRYSELPVDGLPTLRKHKRYDDLTTIRDCGE